MLEAQLYIGKEIPDFNKVKTIKNEFIKPIGGLWTSTYKDNSSSWVDWLISENFRSPFEDRWAILKPKKDAKILIIDSFDDLWSLYVKFSFENLEKFKGFLDYEAISKSYDAINLTKKGEIETRFSPEISLYGWDCESTLWFRWVFDSVEEIKVPFSEKK